MTVDRKKFPHTCDQCKQPAYMGATAHECSNPMCRMWVGEIRVEKYDISPGITLKDVVKVDIPPVENIVLSKWGEGYHLGLLRAAEFIEERLATAELRDLRREFEGLAAELRAASDGATLRSLYEYLPGGSRRRNE